MFEILDVKTYYFHHNHLDHDHFDLKSNMPIHMNHYGYSNIITIITVVMCKKKNRFGRLNVTCH